MGARSYLLQYQEGDGWVKLDIESMVMKPLIREITLAFSKKVACQNSGKPCNSGKILVDRAVSYCKVLL